MELQSSLWESLKMTEADLESMEVSSITNKLGIELAVGDKVTIVQDYIENIKALNVGFQGDEIGIITDFVKIESEPKAYVKFTNTHLTIKNFVESLEKWQLIS